MRNLVFALFLCIPALFYAAPAGNDPDRITGLYSAEYEGEKSRISIYRNDGGTYSAQVVWVSNRYDASGKVRTDEKNPDKAKRDTPCDEIVIIERMSYDSRKNSWGNARVYDPLRGIKANVTCSFEPDGRLKVRGSLMGIGMSVYWTRLE